MCFDGFALGGERLPVEAPYPTEDHAGKRGDDGTYQQIVERLQFLEVVHDEVVDVAHLGHADTITLHGNEDGEELAVTVKRLIDPAKPEPYFGPKRGHKYVAVDLMLKNTGTIPYNDSPGNGAELIDNRDQGYTDALVDSPSCHYIGSGVKIAPGSRRAGCLVFEIEERNDPSLFQFTMASGFADETGEWILR